MGVAQWSMVAWFVLLVGVNGWLLVQQWRLPFFFVLDRSGQRKVLIGVIAGAVGEVVTLAVGGFWKGLL